MADEKDVPFFTAAKVESFTWEVKIPRPAAGSYRFITFTGQFKYLQRAELDALQAEVDPATKRPLSDRQLCERVLTGIVQLQGESAPQVRTEADVIRQVLDVDCAPAAVFGTYMAVIRGWGAEKNS